MEQHKEVMGQWFMGHYIKKLKLPSDPTKVGWRHTN